MRCPAKLYTIVVRDPGMGADEVRTILSGYKSFQSALTRAIRACDELKGDCEVSISSLLPVARLSSKDGVLTYTMIG